LPRLKKPNGRNRCFIKLWQGCGKNPDLANKTDTIDKFLLSRMSNLRVFNAPQLHPAYKLARHIIYSQILTQKTLR